MDDSTLSTYQSTIDNLVNIISTIDPQQKSLHGLRDRRRRVFFVDASGRRGQMAFPDGTAPPPPEQGDGTAAGSGVHVLPGDRPMVPQGADEASAQPTAHSEL